VPSPGFDHDLGFLQSVEDLAVEQLVAHLLPSRRSCDRFRYRLTLCRQHINLPQLRDNLFRSVSLPCH
jgi:hypothetical protein